MKSFLVSVLFTISFSAFFLSACSDTIVFQEKLDERVCDGSECAMSPEKKGELSVVDGNTAAKEVVITADNFAKHKSGTSCKTQTDCLLNGISVGLSCIRNRCEKARHECIPDPRNQKCKQYGMYCSTSSKTCVTPSCPMTEKHLCSVLHVKKPATCSSCVLGETCAGVYICDSSSIVQCGEVKCRKVAESP